MAGQIYERLHTRDLTVMGGMWGQFRYLAPLMMFFCAALLGIPGTGNFIGEILILLGAFEKYQAFTIIAAASLVLAGLYSLILIYQALFGDDTSPQLAKKYGGNLRDLNKRELSLLGVLAIGLLWLGLYPQPILNTSNSAMSWIGAAYTQGVKAGETKHGVRLIDGNMADHMHQQSHQHHNHHQHLHTDSTGE